MNSPETEHLHEDLSQQVEALQRQSFILHLALIVVTGTFVFFLCYQAHVAKSNLDLFRTQAQQMIKTYAGINRTGMDAFANQITAYATTHPEFQPILKKYGWAPPTTPPAAVRK